MASSSQAGKLSGPVPPQGPPPSIAMIAMCEDSLPALKEREQKLQSRLAMQRQLLVNTEHELQAISLMIKKREEQQASALPRLHEDDAREKTKKLAAEQNQDKPRPSKSRRLG